MIFVDSDIFVIDLRYQRDDKYTTNKKFLDKVSIDGMITTSIFNILELRLYYCVKTMSHPWSPSVRM